MAFTFSDLIDVAPDVFTVPVRGVDFTVDAPSAVRGIAIRGFLQAARASAEAPTSRKAAATFKRATAALAALSGIDDPDSLDDDPHGTARLVMGTAAVDDLLERGVTLRQMQHIFTAFMAFVDYGPETAMQVWEGKALGAADQPPTETQTREDEATTTP